ncbi:hypothetical protein GCM10010377_49070 [Streptomyces viridiviolaceus]|uniref:Uncharacterized protein n=1 Tax=Streptomyces viridiviolaceus TaxID=68282 RepID=A0ABW2E8B9_9ACTN|nr:hypothetical protein [Streptomyces viridiviolaceus]GHB52134.1 hypothetical protein GCM10010377_49070 [Streptomyces viridiviolaceus]
MFSRRRARNCSDEAITRAASKTLARHADSTDPRLGAASLEGAPLLNESGAFDRLTVELERPAVNPVFVAVTDAYVRDRDGRLSDAQS